MQQNYSALISNSAKLLHCQTWISLGRMGWCWGSACCCCLGWLKVPVLQEMADADGQNVGAGEEQRVPKAWACPLDQARSTLQLWGNEV